MLEVTAVAGREISILPVYLFLFNYSQGNMAETLEVGLTVFLGKQRESERLRGAAETVSALSMCVPRGWAAQRSDLSASARWVLADLQPLFPQGYKSGFNGVTPHLLETGIVTLLTAILQWLRVFEMNRELALRLIPFTKLTSCFSVRSNLVPPSPKERNVNT